MDSGSLICQPKKPKLNDGDGSGRSIEDLPDSILKHILSFLPTEDAVRTGALSKKWQYMWTSISNLHFREKDHFSKEHFMNSVERVLLLHNLSCIKSFSPKCSVLHDTFRVKSWVHATAKDGIQKLSLHLSKIKKEFILPYYLFTCPSLEVLQLQMRCPLKIPSSFDCSECNLKILILNDVIFLDDDSTQKLFSGSALEELTIKNCNWGNLNSVSISAPKLRSLSISESGKQNWRSDCDVLIFGSRLRVFKYFGKCSNYYTLDGTSSVVEACIHVFNWVLGSEQDADQVNKLLRALPNVKSISLSSGTIKVLDCAAELFEMLPLPVFNNLAHIYLGAVDCDGKALQKILQNSLHLEAITFDEVVNWCSEINREIGILDPLPSCFLSNLRSIEFKFGGSWEEIYVIKNLLWKAAVLDKMIISFSQDFGTNSNKQKKVFELLLELPRKSKSCELVLA